MTVAGGLVLAAFVSPLLFYAGAGAVAVPILIHLLARRRFRRIRWAATAFLLQAERQNRRRVRIEQLILLGLRCLAVLLLALLVARPYLDPSGLAALVGAGEARERILILDDSFSMAARAGNATTFELARKWSEGLLDSLQQDSPGDRVTILSASRPDAPLVSGQYLDDAHVQEMKETLEGSEVSQRAFPLEGALAAVREWLNTLGNGTGIVAYLVSDFRQADWAGSDGAALVEALRNLANRRADGGSIELVLVDVGLKEESNLAITGIQVSRAQAIEGVPCRLDVSIANLGAQPVESVELRLFVDDAAQPGRTIPRIEAKETIQVAAEVTFLQQGWGSLRAEVSGKDSLPIDDSRYLGVEVVRAIRIGVVNGEPDADVYADEVALLRSALRPEGEVFSGNQVTVLELAQLEDTRFEDFELLILANVYRPAGAVVAKLEKHLEAGGGVVFFLGDQVDPASYNELLYREGAGPLPVRLGEAVVSDAATGGVPLATEDLTHPLVHCFSGSRHLLSGPRFWGYFSCSEPSGPAAATQEGVASQPADGRRQAKVVLCLSDAQRTPLIVERAIGRGRAVLVTTSCDREWNNWAESISFPVMVLEMATYVSRSGPDERAGVLVGGPIEMEIAADQFEPAAKVRGPDYPATAEVNQRAEPSATTGGLVLRWTQTDQCGVYRFNLRQRNGEEQVRLAAVNLDPRESDLKKMNKAELKGVLAGVPFRFVDESDERPALAATNRREVWPAVLAAVLAVLMLEQFLAWHFGRRT